MRGDGAELEGGAVGLARDLDGDVEVAALADLHDLCAGWRAAGCAPAQELGYQRDRVLRGGEADALRGVGAAGEELAGAEAVLAADQCVEAFEREGEVRAALVVGDGVDLVDDDGANVAQVLARLGRR